MRQYIFTKRERKAIEAFLKDRKRNATVNEVVFQLDESMESVGKDFKLVLELKRLVDAGY